MIGASVFTVHRVATGPPLFVEEEESDDTSHSLRLRSSEPVAIISEWDPEITHTKENCDDNNMRNKL